MSSGGVDCADARDLITISSKQRRFASFTTDVLVYTVVLNLFVEYWDQIVIDSFTISVLTAVVLKVLLDALIAVEHRLSEAIRPHSALLAVLATWLVLFLSKFVVLEVVDVLFGDEVELGKFLDVVVLVIALMLAREVFGRIYAALGPDEPTPSVVEESA
jgi:hypothetical protein